MGEINRDLSAIMRETLFGTGDLVPGGGQRARVLQESTGSPPVGGSGRVGLSVLMPCHNEAGSVRGSLSKTTETLRKQFDRSFEILLVDDGSSDGTGEIAQDVALILPEVRVVRISENGGKGEALRRAFDQAKGTLVCFLDGDLDIQPEHIVPFVDTLEAKSIDVVIGSKRQIGGFSSASREATRLSPRLNRKE